MIALIEPSQIVHRLRDKVTDKLLLRTRDTIMHVTIFQVFIVFDKDYDPNTLPPNLLKVFQEYIDEQLQNQIQEVKQHIGETTVQATKEWLIIGKDMPSHLAIRVHCRQLDDLLFNLKHKANELGQAWMSLLAQELKERQMGGQMGMNPTGATIQGKGWTLIIGYTANVDYKTHVTLGILPTGDPEMDNLLKMQHQDANRVIAPIFFAEEGDPKQTDIALRYSESMAHVRIDQLKELCEEEVKTYSHLVEQVIRAKQGQEVMITRFVIEEWGRFRLSTFGDLSSLFDEDSTVRVAGIQSNVINMDRMQNFEL
jgi:hypothetical protein